jgi:hypothetical protein
MFALPAVLLRLELLLHDHDPEYLLQHLAHVLLLPDRHQQLSQRETHPHQQQSASLLLL